MYKLTVAYDSNAPHWSAEYENEFGAWENFFHSPIGDLLMNTQL